MQQVYTAMTVIYMFLPGAIEAMRYITRNAMTALLESFVVIYIITTWFVIDHWYLLDPQAVLIGSLSV